MLEVGKTREGRFLIVFLIQFLTFSGFLAYHEVTAIPTDAIITMLAILMGMASLGFLSAVNTVVAVEGVEMLAERYLRKRYEVGLKEGAEKGKAEGLTEAWQSLADMEPSQPRRRNGRSPPFNEPTPTLNNPT